MQRLSISFDDDLAQDFEALIQARQYGNRSEAIRDLVRRELRQDRLQADPKRACVASCSWITRSAWLKVGCALRIADVVHIGKDSGQGAGGA